MYMYARDCLERPGTRLSAGKAGCLKQRKLTTKEDRSTVNELLHRVSAASRVLAVRARGRRPSGKG